MNMKNESMGSLKEIVASELNDNHSGVRSVVTVALALWLGLVFLLGTQGAFVRTSGFTTPADFLRLRDSFGGVFCGILRMECIPGLRPWRRPPARDRDTSVAVGRPGLSLALCIWRSAGPVRFPGRTRGHGDRGDRAVDRARAYSPSVIRGQPAVCDLECHGDH